MTNLTLKIELLFARLAVAWMMLALILPASARAQSEAESATQLQVRTSGDHSKTIHSISKGDKVKLRLSDGPGWVRGKVTEIQDSSVVVGDQSVPLRKITQLNSPPEGALVFSGALLFTIATGLGISGWLLGRAIVKKQLHNWWQWTLVLLGALAVLLLLPLAFIAALLVWALSSRHYQIGKAYILRVFQKDRPTYL